jgi:hypothetical protein
MGSNPVGVIMNHNQEKVFWFVCMVFCYGLLAYVATELIIWKSSGAELWHLFGIGLLCFMTSSAYKSMYYYEQHRNKNQRNSQ